MRQGCSLSPTLFNIYINELARALEQSAAPGLTLLESEVKCLLFADDLVLLSPTKEGQQGQQQHLQILESVIEPIAHYGCEVWDPLTSPDHEKQLDFDSKRYEGLLYRLMESGGKTYNIIKSMYTNNKCEVKIGNKTHTFLSTGLWCETGIPSSRYLSANWRGYQKSLQHPASPC